MRPKAIIRFHDGQQGAAVTVTVRVVPRSHRNQIVDVMNDGTLKVRLTKPPIEDQANQELIKFLAKVLDVAPSQLEIVAGHTGRNKLISILSIEPGVVEQRVLEHIAQG